MAANTPITLQQLANAQRDAKDLERYVNDDEPGFVPTRIGGAKPNYAQILAWMTRKFEDFILSSGYQDIGDYGPGLQITERNQVFWKGGELYRAGASLPLPYVTTGDWGDESGEFVAVGDAALRQDLADVEQDRGAGIVAYAQPGGPAIRVRSRLLDEAILPMEYGARGDQEYDDSTALDELLHYARDKQIDWGSADKRYRITRPIIVPRGRALQWAASGASISYDSSTYVAQAIFIDELPDGHHQIAGLVIDGRDNCMQGLRLVSAVGATGSVEISSTHVRNVRRQSTVHDEAGSGIYYTGCHDQVSITNSSVRHLRMSAGAGLPGTRGVHGIAVRAGSGGRPRLVNVNFNVLDDVACDDLAYTSDQDGILVFADRSTSPNLQQEMHVNCFGNFFKNCLGRAIKGQAESMVVHGARVVRTRGWATRLGVDIDAQVGWAQIGGVSAVYDGPNSAPNMTINLSATDQPKPSSCGTVDGVSVAMSGGAAMESVVQLGQRTALRPHIYEVENVGVVGGALDCVVRAASIANGEIHLTLRKAEAAPLIAFVMGTNGPSIGTVSIDRAINTGATPVFGYVGRTTSVKLLPSISGSYGLRDTAHAGAESAVINGVQVGAYGNHFRINAIAGEGDDIGGGVLRPVVVLSIAPGETAELPLSFRSSSRSGLLSVVVAKGRGDIAVLASDSAGVTKYFGGTSMVADSGTTMPTSGTFRFWAGPNGMPMVANFDTTTRIFTISMLG